MVKDSESLINVDEKQLQAQPLMKVNLAYFESSHAPSIVTPMIIINLEKIKNLSLKMYKMLIQVS